MKFFMSLCLVSLLTATLIVAKGLGKRAPRPNALSYPGSIPQIIGSSDAEILEKIQQRICEIKNSLQAVDCDAMPLTDQVVAITIDIPGNYCLASDVIQDITITATGVTLDLNNHRVSSVAITSVDDVVLRNGTIIDSPVNGILITDSTAIFVTNVVIEDTSASSLRVDRSRNIRITNVAVHNVGSTAMNLIDVSAMHIEGVVIGFAVTGISMTRSVGFIITDTIIYNCIGSGFFTIMNAVMTNCIAFYNGNNGFRFVGNIILNNCQAIQNVEQGIRVQGGIAQLHNCNVIGNNIGIVCRQAQIICNQCVSSANLSEGFFMDLSSAGLIRGCSANNNGSYGFRSGASSTVVYVNNSASYNNGLGTGQNYSVAAGVAPFFSRLATDIVNGVNYWTNVAMPTLP